MDFKYSKLVLCGFTVLVFFAQNACLGFCSHHQAVFVGECPCVSAADDCCPCEKETGGCVHFLHLDLDDYNQSGKAALELQGYAKDPLSNGSSQREVSTFPSPPDRISPLFPRHGNMSGIWGRSLLSRYCVART